MLPVGDRDGRVGEFEGEESRLEELDLPGDEDEDREMIEAHGLAGACRPVASFFLTGEW